MDAISGAVRELESAGYIIRYQRRDRQGRISDTEYVIYEQPQPKRGVETPSEDMQPDMTPPHPENPDMDVPDQETPAELKIDQEKTDQSNTHRARTDFFPFRAAAAWPPEGNGRGSLSLPETERYRRLILENIDYDHLRAQAGPYREDLDEIVELLVETVCAQRKTTRISGADFPHDIVRSRLLKLNSAHIEFVMDCLQKNTTQVRNMKQYLLAVLYNAPVTMNNSYTSQANHDTAGSW